MAKGRKNRQHWKQRRVKNDFKKKLKGQKRNLKEIVGSHSNDTERDDGILVKKPKKDSSTIESNEIDSSDSEQDVGNLYLELVNSLGAGPGSYGEELKEKWKDDESDKNDEEEIEEEMVQTENEDEVKEANKQEDSEGDNVSKDVEDDENGTDEPENMADDYRTEGAAREEIEDGKEKNESSDTDEREGKVLV
ncbi:hypothetical protein pdam_00015462, partial [Pocillopora damicornis]